MAGKKLRRWRNGHLKMAGRDSSTGSWAQAPCRLRLELQQLGHLFPYLLLGRIMFIGGKRRWPDWDYLPPFVFELVRER